MGKRKRGTRSQIVRSWMNSPPHRKVMLDGAFEHVGVGVTWGARRVRTDGQDLHRGVRVQAG